MQHRDKTLLVKIIHELDVALEMIRGKDFDTFDNDEILKRAMCMTVINIEEHCRIPQHSGSQISNLAHERRVLYSNN